jgi:hypothetical protein
MLHQTMSLKNTTIFLMGIAMLSWSCVGEKPSDCIVEVAVRDKNYDNALETGNPLIGESLPMLSYINSLVLRNHVIDTDSYMVYDETLAPGLLRHRIDPSRFSPNDNDITVTGNSPVARQYVTGQNVISLHADGLESDDIYMGYDRIRSPIAANHTIWLYRTKGLLIIEPVNMPTNTRAVNVSISSLYATADRGEGGLPKYSGVTSVTKMFDTTSTGDGARFRTILAPSVAASLSPLTITFSFADGASDAISLDVTMIRNHITLIRPEYKSTTKTWEITVMIDGKWEKVDNLHIT